MQINRLVYKQYIATMNQHNNDTQLIAQSMGNNINTISCTTARQVLLSPIHII